MINNIKFDSKPYILETSNNIVDDNDLNTVFNEILQNLFNSESKIFNSSDGKFDISPSNYINTVVRHDENSRYSFVFFKTTNEVSFIKYSSLTSSQKRNFLESRLGYILLVNIDDYIFISKKNTLNIKPENLSYSFKLSEEKIKNYMALYDTITKATLRSIQNKEKGINKRELEGIDIKEELEMLNISNDYLSDIVLGNSTEPGSRTSYKKNTGLFSFSSKLLKGDSIGHLIQYYNLLISKFSNNRVFGTLNLDEKISSSFLVEEVPQGQVTFHNIRFHTYEIKDIEGIDNEELNEYLDYINGLYVLDNNNYSNTNIQIEVLNINNNVHIDILFPSHLNLDYINKINHTINKYKLFTINTINSNNIIYTNGKFYKMPLTDIDFTKVKNVFKPKSFLNSTKSEKGRKIDYNNKINHDWSINSIFYNIEQYYKGLSSDNLVICGDLGIEIADHIVFNNLTKEITLIHSKGGDTQSFGASQFHDLVAQATKNIEGFNINNDLIFNRIISLLSSDISCNIKTPKKVCKNRIISNHSKEIAINIINEFKGHPNILKTLVLSINFFDVNGLREIEQRNDYIFEQFKNILARLMGVCGEKSIIFNIFIPEQINV